MPEVSLYQKHVLNDVRSVVFVEQTPELFDIGFSWRQKASSGVWDMIYNNLSSLNYFDQHVPLAYTMFTKDSSK